MKKVAQLALFPFILVFYEIAVYLSNDAYLPAMPSLSTDLGVSHNLAQLTFSAWFFGAAISQIIMGPLSDRFGRRPILLLGGLIFVISTLACSLAPGITLLLIARSIQGLMIGSMIVVGYAAINETLEQTQAIHTMALMRSVTILAPAFGPLLGGVFLLFVNWRWIFGVIFVWSGLALLALFFKMPETITPKSKTDKLDIKVILKQYWRLLKNRPFIKKIISGSFIAGCLITWMLSGPFIVMTKFHYSTVGYGAIQALVFGCFMLGTWLIKRLLTDKNKSVLLRVGMVCLLVGGITALCFSIILPNSLFGIVIPFMCLSLGAGIAFPILTRLTLDDSDEPMGAKMSLLTFTRTLFGVISSALIAFFYNGSLFSVAVMIACFSIVAFLFEVL